MTTYIADIEGTNIKLKEMTGRSEKIIHTIPVGSLYLNDGTSPSDGSGGMEMFEKDQQAVNYLDSVKDGTNVSELQGLNIYPNAEVTRTRTYPTFPDDLKRYERNVLAARASYLEHTSWIKVKKGSVLDQGKNYNECLWESGLGFATFLNEPDRVQTVKTFGSYIDPLEKQNAMKVWPERGSGIQLTERFMKLMGFGDHSSVMAKTTSNTAFEYNMNIGCGNDCYTGRGNCMVTHIGDDDTQGNPSDIYFAGNNSKKQFLKSGASTKQKVKFIVIKEWGDKTQVLIYLIYYHFLKASHGPTVIMITCDMVVFMLCLNLSIPCIYTGAYNPPGITLDPGKKYYSVLEFKPSDSPYEDAVDRLHSKIRGIRGENEHFIKALSAIVDNPETSVEIDGTRRTFTKEFYDVILRDVTDKQTAFETESAVIVAKYSNDQPDSTRIPFIEADIKDIHSRFIIVPFLKIKKGTSNVLTILMTKSYTAQKPADNSKPHILEWLLSKGLNPSMAERDSRMSFKELALKHFSTRMRGGRREGRQIGGSSLGEEEIESLFPADETFDLMDENDPYMYTTNIEIENDSVVYNNPSPNVEEHVFDPNISPDNIEFNLLGVLNETFEETFKMNSSEIPPNIRENLKGTIYTLFVYESYINGFAKIQFDEDDMGRIIRDYELLSVDMPLSISHLQPPASITFVPDISASKSRKTEKIPYGKQSVRQTRKFQRSESQNPYTRGRAMARSMRPGPMRPRRLPPSKRHLTSRGPIPSSLIFKGGYSNSLTLKHKRMQQKRKNKRHTRKIIHKKFKK